MLTEQRTPTKAPERPGWFYGRRNRFDDILPRNVVGQIGAKGSSLFAYTNSLGDGQSVETMDWFGPVIRVVEKAS